jgi:hypothetical protein
MMRVRNHEIDPDEKRHMRRLYPDVAFDWKKITRQLAEKRELCRRYRSRRRHAVAASRSHDREPFYGVYQPGTRTVYANGVPSSAAGVGALLDAVLQIDRRLTYVPPAADSLRRRLKP